MTERGENQAVAVGRDRHTRQGYLVGLEFDCLECFDVGKAIVLLFAW